jgi:hypothetical protein
LGERLTKIIRFLNRQTLNSESDGTARIFAGVPGIPDPVGAKNASVYFLIHSVLIHSASGADVRLSCGWNHGPDGENWEPGSGTLYDSGATTGVAPGVSSPTAMTDVSKVAWIQPLPKVEKTSGGSAATKSLVVSGWLVLKPF